MYTIHVYSDVFILHRIYSDVLILHRIAASPREGPKANLTRNPLQHLVDKVPVDTLT